jgi:MOSC domain-containing protein YiiM
LPKLVTDKDLRGILHCHTDASDGTETLETMAKATRQRGFEYFGVADHSKSAHYAGGLSVEEIAQQHLEANRLNKRFGVGAGELGENITTAGLDLERMSLRTLIELGPTANIELTGLRTPCVLIDRFRAGLKRHVLSSAEMVPAFRCGALGVVRLGGTVAACDTARVRLPSSFRALPSL